MAAAPTTHASRATEADVADTKRVDVERWLRAIAESALTANGRLHAHTLALHMSRNGASCFASHATLRAEAGTSTRSVVNAISELRENGYVVTPAWVRLARHAGRMTVVERDPWQADGHGRGRGWVLEYEAVVPE
jgi:predicted ABC-type ATPase